MCDASPVSKHKILGAAVYPVGPAAEARVTRSLRRDAPEEDFFFASVYLVQSRERERRYFGKGFTLSSGPAQDRLRRFFFPFPLPNQ